MTITLLQNGKDYLTTQTNAANGWKYSFKGVPKTDDKGKAYSYSVKETPVDGYTSTVDGYTITNTHKTKTINICGKKVWDDANNQDGKRPQSVTINLLANGVKVKSATATAATQWGYISRTFLSSPKARRFPIPLPRMRSLAIPPRCPVPPPTASPSPTSTRPR